MPIDSIEQTLLMYILVEYLGVSLKIAFVIVLFLWDNIMYKITDYSYKKV